MSCRGECAPGRDGHSPSCVDGPYADGPRPGDIVTGESGGLAFIGRVHGVQHWRSRWGNGARSHVVVKLDGPHPAAYECRGEWIVQVPDQQIALTVIERCTLPARNTGAGLVLAGAV